MSKLIEEALEFTKKVLIKPFEGYHKKLPNGDCISYPDPGTGGDPWTIGWGSTGKNIKPNTIWTADKAEEALDEDVLKFMLGVLELSPGLVNEPYRRLSALTSFAYNCGLRNYKISTLRKKVNEKDWEEAYFQIQKWNKAAGRVLPGLTRRRLAEANLLR